MDFITVVSLGVQHLSMSFIENLCITCIFTNYCNSGGGPLVSFHLYTWITIALTDGCRLIRKAFSKGSKGYVPSIPTFTPAVSSRSELALWSLNKVYHASLKSRYSLQPTWPITKNNRACTSSLAHWPKQIELNSVKDLPFSLSQSQNFLSTI